ncbi:MAG: peptide MFS transporter [Cytophagaceae bacterium]|nr:peptide MFS transporter [Cytophagaceae bacterium]
MQDKSFFGHPRGLFVLFLTEMWERFGYYGMRAILLLFLISPTARGAMGLPEAEGTSIYALYVASVYLLTLPGGWIADNILGQKKSIIYGGGLITLGYAILAISSSPSTFYIGLVAVAFGTGLLKANISTIVGELYPEGGRKRDEAFSIFYMGINVGSTLGIAMVGYIGEKVNWHLGFATASIAMLFGLITFIFMGRTYLKGIGDEPSAKVKVSDTNAVVHPPINKNVLYIIIGALVVLYAALHFTGKIDFSNAQGLANAAGIIIVSITIAYFLFILLGGGLNTVEKKRVAVLGVLFFAVSIFWSGFEQAATSFQIFASRHTERTFFGWEMPSSWFQFFNAAFIVMLAPLVNSLWAFLEKRNMNPSTPVKFAIGLILMGVGFYVMVLGANIAVTGVKASFIFLSVTYVLHTIGELSISPVGLSSYTKLAPRQYVSQFMGIWFVGASLGNLIAGIFAGGPSFKRKTSILSR